MIRGMYRDGHYKYEQSNGDNHYKWEECTGDWHYKWGGCTVDGPYIWEKYKGDRHRKWKECTGTDITSIQIQKYIGTGSSLQDGEHFMLSSSQEPSKCLFKMILSC